MTCDPTDGGAAVEIPAQVRPAKASPQAENPLKTLDALVIELGRLAAQQDFKIMVQDKVASDDLRSSGGRE